MTNELWKGLLVGVVAFGLAACKGEDTASGTQTEAATTAQDDHGHTHGDDDHEHVTDATILTDDIADDIADDIVDDIVDDNVEDSAEAVPAMTQESAEGVLALFTDALKQGDFAGAAAVSDPSSIGYESLTRFAESLEQAASNPQAEGFVETLRSMYSTPWEGAKSTAVSIRDERAKYDVTFSNGYSLSLDIVKSDGLWQIFLPEGFLDVGVEKKNPTGVPDGQAGS